mgnify:CR=1 FL=1
MKFFDLNANTLTSRDFNKVGEFLLYIDKWTVGTDEDNSMNIHTISQFIKTAIHNISKVYPTILSNKADFYKKVCEHWGFSANHNMDITSFVAKYYKGLEKFKGDDVIINMLLSMRTKLLDISLFVENIPVNTDIKKKMMNEKDELAIVIPAEGTRSRVEEWKSGFYHIASKANVDICLGYLDYKTKTAGIDKIIHPTGDIKNDLEAIEIYYKKYTGKNPEMYNPVIFKRD